MHFLTQRRPATPPVCHSPTRLQRRRCNALRHLFLSFFFSLFSHKACMLKSGQEEKSKKNPNRRTPTRFQKGGKGRLQSYYYSVTQLDHSRNIASCKHACWKPTAETVQLIRKNAKFSCHVQTSDPGSCTLSGLVAPAARRPGAPRPTCDTSSMNEK